MKVVKEYDGPWPPYPGMYPCLVLDGAILMVSVWDKDVSLETIKEDASRMVPGEGDTVVAAIHFGTADEVAAYLKARAKPTVLDLDGTNDATRSDFYTAMARHALDALSIKA